VRKRFVERNLGLAIERMIDVCKHLVATLSLPQPDSYAEWFAALAAAAVIPAKAAATFQVTVRFSNLLVHGYETVEGAVTYAVFTAHLDDVRLFLTVIRGCMATAGSVA